MIGKNVALYRKKAKMTQAQLADSVGVTSGFISMLETGRTSVSSEVLKKIAETLGVSTAVLTGESEDPVEILINSLQKLTKSGSIVWNRYKADKKFEQIFEWIIDLAGAYGVEDIFGSDDWKNMILRSEALDINGLQDTYFLIWTKRDTEIFVALMGKIKVAEENNRRAIRPILVDHSRDRDSIMDLYQIAQMSSLKKIPIFQALENLEKYEESPDGK